MRTEQDDQISTGIPYAAVAGTRMRGVASLGGYFDVPLITHVKDFPVEGSRRVGRLWQGGCIQGVRLPEDFDFVLSLYPWEKYILGPRTTRTEVTMYDALDQGFEQIDELADGVVARLQKGEKVLVHCQAGLNRSGLLAAATLVKLGSDPSDAIDLLRKSRGTNEVLCNASFEAHVRSLSA